ncbi:MAG TPA: hypothetical protein VEY71_03400, partial [Chitinophagales bacterium]|nr:hypothetical protein [Chitinophagales bacterium]
MRPVPIGDPHPRMGWLLSEAKLTQLYDRLWLAGKIECTYGSFAAHFIGQPAEKIRWLATIGELVLLISA